MTHDYILPRIVERNYELNVDNLALGSKILWRLRYVAGAISENYFCSVASAVGF